MLGRRGGVELCASSEAPSRIMSRKEVSSDPNRQVFKLPSAVSRSRLHPPQKGCTAGGLGMRDVREGEYKEDGRGGEGRGGKARAALA